MMNISYLSDLHIDRHFGIPQLDAEGADMLVLAGDIADGIDGLRWAVSQQQRLNIPVIYVPGNHEYFGDDLQSMDARLAFHAERQPDLHLLQCRTFVLGGIAFLGCTLWTDFALYPERDYSAEAAEDLMPDYTHIHQEGRRLRAADTTALHWQHRDWLEKELKTQSAKGMTCVVVTHHAPAPASIPLRYDGAFLSPAFASDLSRFMMASWAPVLWIHGHVHVSSDYKIGRTRVVANPRGYPDETASLSSTFSWNTSTTI